MGNSCAASFPCGEMTFQRNVILQILFIEEIVFCYAIINNKNLTVMMDVCIIYCELLLQL